MTQTYKNWNDRFKQQISRYNNCECSISVPLFFLNSIHTNNNNYNNNKKQNLLQDSPSIKKNKKNKKHKKEENVTHHCWVITQKLSSEYLTVLCARLFFFFVGTFYCYSNCFIKHIF